MALKQAHGVPDDRLFLRGDPLQHGSLRFELLDGLRGLAAIAVLVDNVGSQTLLHLFPHTPMAVDFFYVLSGFVMAHAYGARLAGTSSNPLGAWSFLRLRLARFWPMSIAAMAVALGWSLYLSARGWGEALDPSATTVQVVLGLLFLPTPPPFSHAMIFPFVAAMHTMFFELFANLVLAFLAPLLTRSRLMVVLLATGAGLVFTAARFGTLDVGYDWPTFAGGFGRVLYPFFAGVAVYEFWRRAPAPSPPAWFPTLILIAIFAIPVDGAGYEIICSVAVFPLMVWLGAGAIVAGRVKWLCLQAGGLSYGFYLLHSPMNPWIAAAVTKLGFDPAALDIWMFVITGAAVLALVAALRPTFDVPLQKQLRNLLARN